MLSKYIPKRYATAMLKHVVAVSLFFPYVYSKSVNIFYADFILANFFAILAMIFILTSWELDFKKNGILLAIMGILLIAYNVSATYMNYNYHHWYGEQINTTISFLLFIVLLIVKQPSELIDDSTIKSIIHMMIITNLISIAYRLFAGYNSLFFINNYAKTVTNFEETIMQYSWLYLHKSQYAFILVVCIAFCVIYKRMFKNIVTYLLSLGILLFALYLSDNYTSMAATILIFAGKFLDYLWKAKWWKKLIAIISFSLPCILVSSWLYNSIVANREFLSLGGRTRIWKGSWETIINNPNGVLNFTMGIDTFPFLTHEEGWSVYTYNCHNIFLNHMFRYSVLVGSIFIIMIIIIFLFALKRKPCFQTMFILLAFLIPWTMDYSMLSAETTFTLLIFSCLFFINKHNTL